MDFQSIMTKFGDVADKLATGLTNQSYRFVIILIFALAAGASFLFSSNINLAGSILAIGVMGMLFGLLAPENRPDGWQAIWTFVLMLTFFVFAVFILLFMYFSAQPSTPSQREEAAWQTFQNGKFLALNEGLRSHLAEAGFTNESGFGRRDTTAGELFQAIDSYVNATPESRQNLLDVADAIEDYRRCMFIGCSDQAITAKFDDRLVDIWSNFRCSLTKIATSGGYSDTMMIETKRRFEFLMARTGALKDSTEICGAALKLVAVPPDCPAAPSDVIVFERPWKLQISDVIVI